MSIVLKNVIGINRVPFFYLFRFINCHPLINRSVEIFTLLYDILENIIHSSYIVMYCYRDVFYNSYLVFYLFILCTCLVSMYFYTSTQVFLIILRRSILNNT